MERQKDFFNVDYNLDNWKWGFTSISEMRKDLDELEKLGATHIDIDTYESYGCAYLEIGVKSERFETDEEFELRKAKEIDKDRAIRQKELEQLKKLQDKYLKQN